MSSSNNVVTWMNQWGGLHSLKMASKEVTFISYKNGALYLHAKKCLKIGELCCKN